MSVQNLYILFNKRLKNTWWKYRDAVTCFSNSEILWGSESKLYICTFFQNKFNDMLLIDEMCGQNILNTNILVDQNDFNKRENYAHLNLGRNQNS